MTSQKPSWNLGRFVKTLSYFGAIPFLGSLDWMQQWFGSRGNPIDLQAGCMKVILVAGATGGVGRRVVRQLREQGFQVRSIGRDAARAEAILGDVEAIEADITIAETLTPALMKDVSAIVCCTDRVQPEGDPPSQEKYYQDGEFDPPEQMDVPEQVEYHGICNLVAAAKSLPARTQTIFDFTQPSIDLKAAWGALDDVVMGGVSESSIRLGEAAAVFFGTVSTANSGGFASIRTRNFDPAIDLSAYDGVELRVRGDGNRYKFMLRSEDRWDGIAYCQSFDTVADDGVADDTAANNTAANVWTTVRIPFADLIPVFRAKTVREAGAIDASKIQSFQLMLSKFEYDGALNPHFTLGLFQLEVESIAVYGKTLPQFVLVSAAGVTRPGQVGLNPEEEASAGRMNDPLGGILTWKLRGEAALRQSGLTYTIIRPCALTEAAGGQPLIFAQGDTLKGSVSREDIAQLCIAALRMPGAANVTIEVAEGEGGCQPNDWDCLFAQVQPDAKIQP